jgi:hypothetical protein
MLDAPDLLSVVGLMREFTCHWAVCGGWAIDLFLGEEARSHKDVDVSVLYRDQRALRKYMRARGWSGEIAHDGKLTLWEDGEWLELPRNTIWWKHPSYQPDFVETLFDCVDGTRYVFRPDRCITRPIEKAFLVSRDGIPYLAPEIALLYKSRHADHEHNTDDFRRSIPHLSLEQSTWLEAGIRKTMPDHFWLEAIAIIL